MTWFYLQIDPDQEDRPVLHRSCCASVYRDKKNILLGWYTNSQIALAAARDTHPGITRCSGCGSLHHQRPTRSGFQPVSPARRLDFL